MTGPALRNVEQRLADDEGLDREWIAAWIRNSAAVIASGDAYANKIYDEYGGAAMTPYPGFSDQDINDILAYTAEEAPPPPTGTTEVGATPAAGAGDGVSNKLILGALAVLFGLLAFAFSIG